jgi:hypothetical protein
MFRQICDPAAVFPGKTARDKHSIGVSVGPRKDRGKYHAPFKESNHDSLVTLPIAYSRYELKYCCTFLAGFFLLKALDSSQWHCVDMRWKRINSFALSRLKVGWIKKKTEPGLFTELCECSRYCSLHQLNRSVKKRSIFTLEAIGCILYKQINKLRV